MSGARAWVAVGLLAALLITGGFALQALLQAEPAGDLPLSMLPLSDQAKPTQTSTPNVRIRVAPQLPAATSTPGPLVQTTPSPAAAGELPSPGPDGPYRLLLPLVEVGQPGPPLGLDLQLTPEPRPTPVERATAAATPVPTRAPTPTRAPLRVTKLGIGLYGSGGAFLPLLDQIRPSVILLMDPTVDFAQAVRKWFPKAFIVGRIYAKDQPLDQPSQRGTAFADLVAQTAVPLKGVVDAWMGYNEVTGHRDYDNYRAYNAFQVAFARRLQDHHGIPAVAGNDGPGTVEPQDYARHFAEAIQTSKYFGIHSYAPKGETSMRSHRSLDLVLRHRQIRAALSAAGVRSGPFIITEAGLWDGWRGVASEESMAEDFLWFADELAKDDYVVGVAVFGLFAPDRWQGFNVAGSSIVERIGAYNTEGWRR